MKVDFLQVWLWKHFFKLPEKYLIPFEITTFFSCQQKCKKFVNGLGQASGNNRSVLYSSMKLFLGTTDIWSAWENFFRVTLEEFCQFQVFRQRKCHVHDSQWPYLHSYQPNSLSSEMARPNFVGHLRSRNGLWPNLEGHCTLKKLFAAWKVKKKNQTSLWY